jgi:hypothetical protein
MSSSFLAVNLRYVLEAKINETVQLAECTKVVFATKNFDK